MTNLTPLSPAAQAVLDAVEDDCIHPNDKHKLAAAALRAAADQVAPLDPCGDDCCIDLSIRIRADLLAIADELKNGNN